MSTTSNEPKTLHSPLRGFLPFFWLAIACLLGILVANLVTLAPWFWAAGFLLSILALILAKTLPISFTMTHQLRRLTRAEQRLPHAAILAVAFLGGWRAAASLPVVTPVQVAYYNERGLVQFSGVVVQPPDPRDDRANLTVAVESMQVGESGEAEWRAVEGKVLVQAPPDRDWAYGDQLRVIGELETPTESADFSYQAYLARRGILSLMSHGKVEQVGAGGGRALRSGIYRLSDRGYDTLQILFPSPESDLLAGILLGRDQGLSPDLQDAFRETGTSHIIAISGFNIAILAGMFSAISTRLFGRRWGALIALVGISGYTVLVGAEAAVVRAAIMGGLGVFGGLFGRRQNGLNSLGMAVLVMLMINPNLPWDIGFQLSVAATLGMVLYAQPLEERCLRFAGRWMPEDQAQKWVAPFSEFFLYTLAAQVLTLPLMAYHFGGISWVAFVANPLILPVQPLVMILGGLAILTGLLLQGLGQAVAMVAQPFVTYTIRMVTWLAGIFGPQMVMPAFHPLWLVIFYTLLFIATLLPKVERRSLVTKALSPQIGALALFGLTIFVWTRVLDAPDGRLHLTLLDSEGTVLIQTPSGETVLLGGGSRPTYLNQRLGERLPADDPDLDVWISGSPYREDLNALTGTLEKFPPRLALWQGDPNLNQTTRAVSRLLSGGEIPVTPLEAGQTLKIGEDILIQVLWTGERGAVFWLTWADFSALLPTGKVADSWIDAPDSPDVVLLPDKSTPDTAPLTALGEWRSAVVLLPLVEADLGVRDENDWEDVLAGYPVVSTLEHGWIEVVTDGAQLWVRAGD